MDSSAKDDEIAALKQKVRDLVRENGEMKELILFLDDERNYAKQFVKEFNNKQMKNWNAMKTKLTLLEQKQFELIRENYSLKQLCVLLDTQSGHSNGANGLIVSTCGSSGRTSSASAFCQYITSLENELRGRGVDVQRPKHVSDALRVNAIRESMTDSGDEKSIIDSLSDTAIKSLLNR